MVGTIQAKFAGIIEQKIGKRKGTPDVCFIFPSVSFAERQNTK